MNRRDFLTMGTAAAPLLALSHEPKPDPRRRVKRILADEHLILDMLSDPGCYVSLPEAAEIPKGAVVQHVYHDYCRRAFVLIVQHESFEPIRDGDEVPHLIGNDGRPMYVERRLFRRRNILETHEPA